MIGLARENGITPVIGLPPPVDFIYEEASLREYRKIMIYLAREYNLAIIDFYHPMLDKAGRGLLAGLHSDGVHPNEEGYNVMRKRQSRYWPIWPGKPVDKNIPNGKNLIIIQIIGRNFRFCAE